MASGFISLTMRTYMEQKQYNSKLLQISPQFDEQLTHFETTKAKFLPN